MPAHLPVLPLRIGLALLTTLCPVLVRAQMLVGCQLVEGTLQCVPGLTADPQQQIKALDRQISTDLQIEGAVQQSIQGLSQLVLKGDALEGSLLTASLLAKAGSAPSQQTFHWYRRGPGSKTWLLIPSATGPTYVPGPQDVGQNLMVVLVVSEADGVKRVSSKPMGPVRRAN